RFAGSACAYRIGCTETLDGRLETFGGWARRNHRAGGDAGSRGKAAPRPARSSGLLEPRPHPSQPESAMSRKFLFVSSPHSLSAASIASRLRNEASIASTTHVRHFSLAGRLAVMCLALACAVPVLASDAPAPLVFSPYAMETKGNGTIATEEAFLEVPRRHSEPDGPRIRLRVVRLPATGGDGRAAPVVYLAGGPRGSRIGTALGPRQPACGGATRE